MAKKGSGMSPARAREYLATKAHSGDVAWKPVKPLSEYSNAEVVRKARSFQKQEREGKPISNQAARGAHPKEIQRSAARSTQPAPRRPSAQKPQPPAKRLASAYNGGKVKKVKQHQYLDKKGRISQREQEREVAQYEGQRLGRMSGTVDAIAQIDPNARIKIAIRDKDGMWHTMYAKHGDGARNLSQRMHGSSDLFTWFMGEVNSIYGDYADDMFGGPGDLEWVIYADGGMAA